QTLKCSRRRVGFKPSQQHSTPRRRDTALAEPCWHRLNCEWLQASAKVETYPIGAYHPMELGVAAVHVLASPRRRGRLSLFIQNSTKNFVDSWPRRCQSSHGALGGVPGKTLQHSAAPLQGCARLGASPMPRTLRAPCDRRFRLSRPRLGTVFHRWLRLPAILEQRLAHQAECRCSGARRSPRPLARGKPALLALEDR